MQHMEKWSVNESLLQSYRQISLSCQGFILTAGAIFYGKASLFAFVLFCLIALAVTWLIWFPIVRARMRVVDFHKHAHLSQAPDSELCSENEYVNCKTHREAANKKFGIKSNWRSTRIKLDIALPVLFSLLWAVLLGYKFESKHLEIISCLTSVG